MKKKKFLRRIGKNNNNKEKTLFSFIFKKKSNKDKNESLFKEENQESNHYKRVSEFDLKLFETKSLIKDNLCSFNEVNLKSEDCLNISILENETKNINEDEDKSNIRKRRFTLPDRNFPEKRNSYFTNNLPEEKKELVFLRKTIQMKSQIISSLTKEIEELYLKSNNFQNMPIHYEEILKTTFKQDINNIKLNFNIFKDFYKEEMIYSKNMITELSSIIEDLVINEKSNKDMKSKKVLRKYFIN